MMNQLQRAGLRLARSLAFFRLSMLLLAGLSVTSLLEGQEQRHLRHILVATEQVANRLMEAAETGTDFRALARRYSLDVGTKLLGGDLDWVSTGAMEPEFTLAAFKIAEPNGLAVCKTRYGWHVIQFVATRGKPIESKPAGEKPATGATEEKPVVSRVPVAGDRNSDLAWTIQFSQRAYSPEDPVLVTIGVRNESDNQLDVLDPVLWPLGLIIRYQFGKLNVPMTMPEGFDPQAMEMRKLESKEYLERTFDLSQYAPVSEPWPIVRVIWRGDSFFGRIEKNVVGIIDLPGFATWKARWRFYRSGEEQFNVLPAVQKEDRWFLCCFTNGRLWIELQDVGIPGLREEIVSQVRNGNLNKVPVTLTMGQSLNFGVNDRSGGGVEIAQATSSSPWNQGSFGVTPSGTLAGPKLGLQFAIGLGPSPASTKKLITCGSVVFEEGDPITRVQERIGKRLAAEMTLVLAYPYSLLPERVKQAASGDSATSKRPNTSQVKPSSGQGAEFSDAQGKTPSVPFVSDLPRVVLNTSGGQITLELFENDSPNTVANFISLVESGFYDGLKFHRRVKTEQNRGFIQGGSPDGTGSGGPGYMIRDETSKNRAAVRGSIIMARNHQVPDTAGSQFLIALDRLAYLDRIYTVFGRIVDGQAVADQLGQGSTIMSAVVNKKRDHEYTPVKIFEK